MLCTSWERTDFFLVGDFFLSFEPAAGIPVPAPTTARVVLGQVARIESVEAAAAVVVGGVQRPDEVPIVRSAVEPASYPDNEESWHGEMESSTEVPSDDAPHLEGAVTRASYEVWLVFDYGFVYYFGRVQRVKKLRENWAAVKPLLTHVLRANEAPKCSWAYGDVPGVHSACCAAQALCVEVVAVPVVECCNCTSPARVYCVNCSEVSLGRCPGRYCARCDKACHLFAHCHRRSTWAAKDQYGVKRHLQPSEGLDVDGNVVARMISRSPLVASLRVQHALCVFSVSVRRVILSFLQ